MKRNLIVATVLTAAILIVAFIATIVVYCPNLLTNSTPTGTEEEQSNKRLDVAIAYAYAGERTSDASITGYDGANLYAVTQYPSAVILNTTL